MKTLALLGIPHADACLIRAALVLIRTRGVHIQAIEGLEAACSTDVVVVNGDDPRALESWVEIRRLNPDPSGLILTGPALRSDCPSDQILRRPLSTRSFLTALGQLDFRRRRAAAARESALPARKLLAGA
jgi:hypothetical protein